jgi:hypothetical protein
MGWQFVDALPIDLGSGIAASRAQAIVQALARRALPLVRLAGGRAEPLASAALYHAHGRLLIVTCKHLFDANVALGDVGVPLAASGRWLWLRDARARAIEDPARDVVFIAIEAPQAVQLLARHWIAVPLAACDDAPAGAWVVAGYPYAQMRRVDATLHAKPVFVFTRTLPQPAGGTLRASYARTALRSDGLQIHAPALDGVSGATCWAIRADAHDDVACVLQPAGVQVAFKHDAYLRAEPLAAQAVGAALARARLSR